MDNRGVIIVAGGGGIRMKSEVPKQFLPLGTEAKPVLVHTVERFIAALPGAQIIVVLPEEYIGTWKDIADKYNIASKHTVCAGGQTRFDSVKNALPIVVGCDFIAIHDGVRPLVDIALIKRTFALAEQHGSAVPVINAVESYRIDTNDGNTQPLDRDRLHVVQTPQVFCSNTLISAYSKPYDSRYTDDATVVESDGNHIYLCEGERQNIKITTPFDMIVAEALLKA